MWIPLSFANNAYPPEKRRLDASRCLYGRGKELQLGRWLPLRTSLRRERSYKPGTLSRGPDATRRNMTNFRRRRLREKKEQETRSKAFAEAADRGLGIEGGKLPLCKI